MCQVWDAFHLQGAEGHTPWEVPRRYRGWASKGVILSFLYHSQLLHCTARTVLYCALLYCALLYCATCTVILVSLTWYHSTFPECGFLLFLLFPLLNSISPLSLVLLLSSSPFYSYALLPCLLTSVGTCFSVVLLRRGETVPPLQTPRLHTNSVKNLPSSSLQTSLVSFSPWLLSLNLWTLLNFFKSKISGYNVLAIKKSVPRLLGHSNSKTLFIGVPCQAWCCLWCLQEVLYLTGVCVCSDRG